MRIGIPREVKDGEYRVALTPGGVARIFQNEISAADEIEIFIEPGAGAESGFSDQEYLVRGAKLGDAWECELVVKVKELQPSEYARPRPGQTVFGFQHFGPHPELLEAALASGATFIAYETTGEAEGLPILAPMSAIAGRLAVQAGAWCLQRQNGGSGVLLSGLEGVPPGKVVILGAGNAGSNALAAAQGMGAQVVIFADSTKRFPPLRKKFPGVEFLDGTHGIEGPVAEADLVIGAVLKPGRLSPKLIGRSLLRRMRRGSALVDVGIDQGGIAETSRPTSHSAPTYIEEGVVHYCVPNMPSACARTASLALERAVLPFMDALLRDSFDPCLKSGIQVKAGRVTHEKLARDTQRAYSPP